MNTEIDRTQSENVASTSRNCETESVTQDESLYNTLAKCKLEQSKNELVLSV